MNIPAMTAVLGSVLLLAACSEPAPPPQQEAPAASAPTAPATQKPISFSETPSGRYKLDLTHASLQFSVVHAYLSNYVVRFNKFDVDVVLDAANPAASSVTVNVDPTSVDTGYQGDYKATHPNATQDSWDETLVQSERFLNASKYPQITFQSTQVEQTAPDKLRVTGDLNLFGQTHPVTLDVTLVGAMAAHPMSKRPALGLSASGTFNRSEFGMAGLMGPISDAVNVRFEGEFSQPAESGA